MKKQKNESSNGQAMPHDPLLDSSAEGPSPILARQVRVTPALASKWLAANHDRNRPIDWRRVESFANDMRSGSWKLTHQGIAFDAGRMLIDGQHRLHAVVQADVAVVMMVFVNQEGCFDDPLDRGRPRSVAMLLGRTNNKVVAALNGLRMLEQGVAIKAPMTLSEAKELLARYESEVNLFQANKQPGALAAACVYAYPCDPNVVLQFIQQVKSGEMIQRGDPAYAWRNWWNRARGMPLWDTMMAGLGCLRAAIAGNRHHSVYTGDSGYRLITGRRRALKVPFTPSVSVVETAGGTWGREQGSGDEAFQALGAIDEEGAE